MSETTENNDLPEQLSSPSQEPEQELPGKRLRAAREAKGLSREKVAGQLRLNVRLISALEEDDYAALPGLTFTTGYLRSYARLLELPADSFAISPLATNKTPPLVSTSAAVKEMSSRDGIARLASYLIIGVIIVSVAMWWMGRQEEFEPQTRLSGTELVESQDNPTAEVTETGEALLQDTSDEVAQSEEVETAELQAEGNASGEEGTAAETEAAAAIEQVKPVPQAAPASTPAATSSVSEQPAPLPLTDAMPQSTLELRFVADSWTEVKDNAGRQLVYRLIKEGGVLVLRGEAPFHVFLGYAPGVTVYYNGELFDHSVFQRRDVARFRIGSAEHNHPILR